jgi:hypothetical protein
MWKNRLRRWPRPTPQIHCAEQLREFVARRKEAIVRVGA